MQIYKLEITHHISIVILCFNKPRLKYEKSIKRYIRLPNFKTHVVTKMVTYLIYIPHNFSSAYKTVTHAPCVIVLLHIISNSNNQVSI